MVDRDRLLKLEEERLIDRTFVLWWQLGFEGRRVYSQDEFDSTIEEITYDYRDFSNGEKKTETIRVWPKDDVPILIQEISIGGIPFTGFISVKPMSHSDSAPHKNGWDALEADKRCGFPINAYYQPHVRGVLIEKTSDFLFWYPLGSSPMHFGGALKFMDKQLEAQDLFCIFDPIHPAKFYKNLIKGGWNKGRRPQKRGKTFNYKRNGLELVPYYEFDINKPHIMIYPAKIFDSKLDFPTIVYADSGKPVILGVGYPNFNFNRDYRECVTYWELDDKEKIARASLIERLGKIN